MSKVPINYSEIKETAKAQFESFASARKAIAVEDIRYKAEIKRLKMKLEKVRDNRKNDLEQGISVDETSEKYSEVEINNTIRKEEDLHREIIKPLNKALKEAYIFVPDGLYDSYARKIEHGKRGDFIECIRLFLENIGIEEASQSALGKLAERTSDCIGVRVSFSKELIEEKIFSNILKENQFKKLFMSVFCDLLIQNKVISMPV